MLKMASVMIVNIFQIIFTLINTIRLNFFEVDYILILLYKPNIVSTKYFILK